MAISFLFPNPPLTNRHKSTLPAAYSGTCGAKKRAACIVCARSQDDYHATLKALNSKGRFPRKSLGQHYMLNSEINDQLVGAANIQEGDLVLEIGPGTGSLTNVLINAGATVLAIEKDPHMVGLVTERFASTERFKVLQENFVKCHIRSHMLSLLESRESSNANAAYAKVVANIPFNISTDVIKQLLPMGDIFSEVVLLLQEETAMRLVKPSLRTSEYRPINIFVNFYSEPAYKFKVPRTSFFPQPNVDAAIVKFKLKQATDYPSVASTKSFFSMVNSAFNGKRKMLRKSLQHLCTSLVIEKALGDVGLPPTSRPEELTLDDFVRLHNLIVEVA
ncbi:ribosomal RNA small subunit methyltransferase, chloroplastic isoform X1 [Mangifera indica]|uniref:ribosomal RNA small subunit methyltransferase, chloroplastic isoform X1 n=1 Tax=Mangifera indica TaxID=29780 RepID=UPI001CFC2F8C|nr:ribosomal RNA small subunit methyltransferase, chloroplastic isoform X1 [Mangifera indica]